MASTDMRPDSPNRIAGKKDFFSSSAFSPTGFGQMQILQSNGVDIFNKSNVLPPIQEGVVVSGPSYGTRSRRNSLPTLTRNSDNASFPQISEGPSVPMTGQISPSSSCPNSPSSSPESPASSRRSSVDESEQFDMSPRKRTLVIDEDYIEEAEQEVDIKQKRRRRNSVVDTQEDPSFATPPKKKTYRKKKKLRFECEGIDKCKLCQHGIPYYLHKSMNPGWRETVLAVFDFFPKRITVNEWRKMHEGAEDIPEIHDEHLTEEEKEIPWLFFPDAYGYLEHHWDILCPPQHKSRNLLVAGTHWRKTIQDTLSHNRTFFLSGKEIFGKTGFWRLISRPQPNIPNGVVPSAILETQAVTSSSPTPVAAAPFGLPKSEFTISSILKVSEGAAPKTQHQPQSNRSCKMEERSAFCGFDLLLAAAEEIEAGHYVL